MNKLCISAYGNNLSAYLSEFFLLLCQSSKLSGSDKGEVSRVKKQYRPFPAFLHSFKARFTEITL
jgi:hypothetical protein